jgi:3',5'-cyclic AMP phosphodiesterase CpdA
MFTLAHLSDPHLAPLPAARWSELLGKRITGYLNWQRGRRFIHNRSVLDRIAADLKARNADHIAVTGDIANIALPQEFANGRLWLESLGSPDDVSFVPGNHDAYVRGGLAFASREWGAYMRGDDGTRGFPYLRRRGPLALIGLSTALPTPWGFATGALGPPQRAAIAKTIEALKHEGLFRVVMIHHPPVSEAHWHKRLLDAAAFRRLIAAHGADLVLHGHDHLHMTSWLDGPNGTRVPAIGVPSASAAPGKSRNAAAYNLYRIDGSAGAWTCDVVSRGLDSGGAIVEQNRSRLIG